MRRSDDATLVAYGEFIAGLAPWREFVTLTHREPKRPNGQPDYSRVGLQRHRRQVREWFYDDVRRFDPSARWWSEMELHESGQPHEHGLLVTRERAPLLSMRQRWWERCGYAYFDPVKSSVGAAAYVAKYAGKAAAWEPCIFGFGLNPRATFSIAAAEIVRTSIPRSVERLD